MSENVLKIPLLRAMKYGCLDLMVALLNIPVRPEDGVVFAMISKEGTHKAFVSSQTNII
jgi:hypothetical protein